MSHAIHILFRCTNYSSPNGETPSNSLYHQSILNIASCLSFAFYWWSLWILFVLSKFLQNGIYWQSSIQLRLEWYPTYLCFQNRTKRLVEHSRINHIIQNVPVLIITCKIPGFMLELKIVWSKRSWLKILNTYF